MRSRRDRKRLSRIDAWWCPFFDPCRLVRQVKQFGKLEEGADHPFFLLRPLPHKAAGVEEKANTIIRIEQTLEQAGNKLVDA